MGDVLSCLWAHGGKVNDLSHILFSRHQFCESRSLVLCMFGKTGRLAGSSSSSHKIVQGLFILSLMAYVWWFMIVSTRENPCRVTGRMTIPAQHFLVFRRVPLHESRASYPQEPESSLPTSGLGRTCCCRCFSMDLVRKQTSFQTALAT